MVYEIFRDRGRKALRYCRQGHVASDWNIEVRRRPYYQSLLTKLLFPGGCFLTVPRFTTNLGFICIYIYIYIHLQISKVTY